LENDSKNNVRDCISNLIKKFAKGNDDDGFRLYEEKFIRRSVCDFPHKQSPLLQQLVRTISSITLGQRPSALSIFTTTLNGRTFDDDETVCDACGEPNADKRCTVCKSVNYCNEKCQRIRWSTHKLQCQINK